ncbi:hypothetical protein CHU98_g7064 [Xylaria longipes]|nr:hypothetical protein CHU98_g7064 [Xylaria longipes]
MSFSIQLQVIDNMREWFRGLGQTIQDWLSQPRTLAAVFQSAMYGGFTPAGGIFATLTSMAMLGILMPAAAISAALLATMVARMVWACGVGR